MKNDALKAVANINEDNFTGNGKVTADTAEAENDEAAVVLGKFKDVQTLMKAYSDLEAEFTRRSQRLKQLEKENKEQAPPDGAEAVPSQTSDAELIQNALGNEKVKEAVIGEYLKNISGAKGVPLISGGGGIAAPRATPKSVKEAGRLAQQFLKS